MERWPLPEGWEWKQVKSVLKSRSGNVDPSKFPDETFALYSMPAYDVNMQPEVTPGREIGSSKRKVYTNDCLFSRLNPRIPRVWIVEEHTERAICSTDFVTWVDKKRPNGKPWFEPEYLRFMLLSPGFRVQVTGNVQGATGSRQRIRREALNTAWLPLPPLDVQRRLVARIETLLAEVDTARRLHVKIEEEGEKLMDAALAEIFGGSHFKKHAEWVTVEELGEVMGGLTKNRRRRSYPLRLPYLRVANVYANELKLDDVQKIGVREAELGRVLLQRGDLLIVEGNGSISQIGRVALWDGSIDPCVHQNHIIKVRFGTSLLSKYILYWLLSPQGRNEIVKVASATSGLYTLSLSKVSNLPVPLVSSAEQRKIIAYLNQIPGQIYDFTRVAEALAADLERTEQAILARAFRGEL